MWSADKFGEFFAAANNGNTPYQWQQRLARRMVTTGRWPSTIAAPTGAGKSSVVDVHVFALAATVGSQCRPPRRLSVVVNRRAIVDSHFDRAERLAELLDHATDGILAEVASRLRQLSTTQHSLVVTSLRGGVPTNARWLDDPRIPAVIAATPDMWGSRLLFRGYGTSRFARPREAGFLGVDSVMVLDEAHLNRQLLQTANDAAALIGPTACRIGAPPGLQVVAATATPDRGAANVDDVEGVREEDLGDDVGLRDALTAPKVLRIVTTTDSPKSGSAAGRYVELLAEHALEIAEKADRRDGVSDTVLCVVNSVETAVHLAERLGKHVGADRVICWVGRLRTLDVDKLKADKPGLFSLEGNADVTFLVATQTVEVGVDIDTAGVVTELAPGSALAQRLGRVNRRGLRSSAEVRVVMPTGAIKADRPPYSARDLQAAKEWLERLGDGADLSPWRLRDEQPPAESYRRHALSDLLPEHLDLLTQTSDALCAEPDLDFWIRDDLEGQDNTVGVVIRAGIPDDDNVAMALLRATPVAAEEIFPARIRDAAELVQRVLAADERARVFCWRAGELGQVAVGDRPRPGDQLVLDRQHSVTRLGVVVSSPPARAEEVTTAWGARGVEVILPDAPNDHWLTDLAEQTAEEAQTRLAAAGLGDFQVILPPSDLVTERDDLPWLVLVPTSQVAADPEVSQEWTPAAAAPVGLDQHQSAVGARAAQFGVDLGLTERVVDALTKAGRHHDDGKADIVFQAMLRGNGSDAHGLVLAKSTARSAQQAQRRRMDAGWRHEQMSAVHTWLRIPDAAERDLIVRLVGTSHGRGLPFFPMGANSLLGGRYPDNVLSAARQLFETGAGWSDVLELTDQKFGPWGAAYLEAVLRAADCQVSSEGS